MIILCVIDLPYQPTYKIVSKHRALRTLNQNHVLKVVDMLNVSQFEFTDLNISVVCIFLTSHVLLDILIQVSPDLCSFNYVNSDVLHFFLIKRTDALISQTYFCQETLHVSGSSSAHHQEFSTVHSCQQKSIGLKFSKSQTGSDVQYSCHHNSSRFTFPIFAYSCHFSVLHSLQSITPRIC